MIRQRGKSAEPLCTCQSNLQARTTDPKQKEPAVWRVLSRSHSCSKARDFESAQLPANKKDKAVATSQYEPEENIADEEV